MLYMSASQHDARVVELSHSQRGISFWWNHVVQRASDMSSAGVSILIQRVIDDLILEADHVILALGRPVSPAIFERKIHQVFEPPFPSAMQEDVILDTVLQSAISSGRDAPVEDQFKVAKCIF